MKKKILLLLFIVVSWLSLESQPLKEGNDERFSIQSSISYCSFDEYKLGIGLSADYRFAIHKYFNVLNTFTRADGGHSDGSISESFDYAGWNIGPEFNIRFYKNFSFYVGSGLSIGWLKLDEIYYQVPVGNSMQDIHVLVAWTSFGYYINSGLRYNITDNLSLGLNYNFSYHTKINSSIQSIGIALRVAIPSK
ncbi:MAG: outer membrane beta-barrel protein [Bacteroidales bacterium]|nr:outer membrane beta-barrel protein [Bacteroidales bacterium]